MTSPVTDRARDRHPAGRRRGGHLVAPLRRLSDALPRPVGPHWEVAFAVLAIRGGEGRSRDRFAAAYGISLEHLSALEDGALDLAQAAAPLRALTPLDRLVAELAASAVV